MNTVISASILSCDLSNIDSEVQRLAAANVDMLHFDVMDGVFVDNISFGLPVLKSVNAHTDMFLDVHLMIETPSKYVEKFAEYGADMITFHIEAEKNVAETLKKIRSFGIKAGISVKPNTPVDVIKPYLPLLDNILIMSVEPGFGGQGFIESSIEKISAARKMLAAGDFQAYVQVDGGINDKTAKLVRDAGADNLVSGSYLFNAANMSAATAILRA
ncbi:MAG: ribulose-phosphate 3-epimerase [Oscillospiraceae bacterium]